MTSPNIEAANDFLHDCLDFLHRYRLTVNAFYAVRSKRWKLFIDLRMATECALKAVIALHLPAVTGREQVIRQVESYGHKIEKLADQTKPNMTENELEAISPFIKELEKLSVGLRYRLDGSDFFKLNEEIYYDTVGSDGWLDRLYDAVQLVAESIDEKLRDHSKIVSVADLEIDDLLTNTHNKYARQTK